MTRLVVNLVNFVDWDLGWAGGEDHLKFRALEWAVQIEPTRGEDVSCDPRAGYRVTHRIVIERHDKQTFSGADVKALLHVLLLWCSFVKGALVGQLLPEGVDDNGSVVYVEWGLTVVDVWSTPFTWCDPTCVCDASDLVGNWLTLQQGPFWGQILARAARVHSTANHPSPLDTALPTALTGLEMLAWAVLVDDEGRVRSEDPSTAAGMIRHLLNWAGVPTDLPDELPHLKRYSSGVRDPDAVTAITQVRNRLVHPPKARDDTWPDSDVLGDAWRMSMEFFDLVILRILGYSGNYGHRRHLEGRWIGDMSPVPWHTTSD